MWRSGRFRRVPWSALAALLVLPGPSLLAAAPAGAGAAVLTGFLQNVTHWLEYLASLLDAAHILRDGHPRGNPVVENGLALCKIHHAAFDQNLIGVNPDKLVVEVRQDVRDEHDGPMLRHGLQEMQGVRLQVPSVRRARPDREREEFRHAG